MLKSLIDEFSDEGYHAYILYNLYKLTNKKEYRDLLLFVLCLTHLILFIPFPLLSP